jgi:hypothetical protein
MEAEILSETLETNSLPTSLVAREDFIAFSRREMLQQGF